MMSEIYLFIMGYTLCSVILRLEGKVPNDDIIYPILIFIVAVMGVIINKFYYTTGTLMGTMVGSKTYFQCDTCKETSVPYYDQIEAREAAYKAGWFKNSNTGKTYCPKCRKGLNEI